METHFVTLRRAGSLLVDLQRVVVREDAEQFLLVLNGVSLKRSEQTA